MTRAQPCAMRALALTLAVALAAGAVLGPAVPLAAQDSLAPRADSLRVSDLACRGQTITGIEVRRQAPPLMGRDAPRWRRRLLPLLFQYRTTRPDVVSDFLQLEQGDRCTALRREETERVLRAQPFIADATVRAEPDAAGQGTRVVVETVDEIPLILSLSLRGSDLRSFRYGNSNVMGAGQLASARWRDGAGFRDGVAVQYEHYHLFGGPNTLAVQLERAPIGGNSLVSLAHPFLTPLQRVAMQAEYRDEDGYRDFIRAGASTRSIGLRRSKVSAGAVYRLARVGGGELSGIFAGAIGGYERADFDGEVVHVGDSDVAPDPDPLISGRYSDFDRTRIGAVVGLSALRFVRVQGFDALEGAQDLGRGAQLSLRVGPQTGTGDASAFGGLDLYVGAGGPTSFVGGRFTADGESRGLLGQWGESFASGRVAWYRKPAARRTLILSGEYSAAWHSRVPYQLTYSARRGGLAGYRKSELAGARRLVGRGEQRWSLRHSPSPLLGLGAALFAEVGKMWAGDVPYAVNSNPRASVGVGLLGAVPRSSRRLLRADVAFPLAVDHGLRRLEFRFTSSVPLRTFFREPSDLASARSSAPSTDLFGWP